MWVFKVLVWKRKNEKVLGHFQEKWKEDVVERIQSNKQQYEDL